MLNVFAVGLDGFPAKMNLLGNSLAGFMQHTHKLKYLHLAIGQALDAVTRGNRFFAQGSLHYGCGNSFAKVQLARQDFAHRSHHLIVAFSFMM